MAKRKSKGFIRKPKDAMSDLPGIVTRTGARVGGGLAAKAGSNFLQKQFPKIPAKLHGPGLLAISILGEAFITEPHVVAAFQGMGVSAGMQTADEFIPEAIKEKAFLNGLGAVEVDASVDWDALRRVAEDDAPIDTRQLGSFRDADEEYWNKDFSSEELRSEMKIQM